MERRKVYKPNTNPSPNSVLGIATVQPHPAIKKCRIRNLRVEYVIGTQEITLTVPQSCGECEKVNYCIEEFVIQIMMKLSRSAQDATGCCISP